MLLPELFGEGSEVQQPEKKVGAVGSIELMVAMAITVIATFNLLKRANWHIFSSFFTLLFLFLPNKQEELNRR